MAEFPALPLFTDSLLADCSHLPDADFGLYMRILILMWRTPDCKIPNDRTWIARRLAKQPLEFDALIKPLIDEFCQTTGNFITQKRLLKEYKYLREQRTRQKANIDARWSGAKPVDNQSVSDKALKNKQSTPQSGNTKTIPPTPPHPTGKEETPLPPATHQPERGGGFKKLGDVGVGSGGGNRPFDIEPLLTDYELREMLVLTPGWSRTELFRQYNEWVAKRGDIPRSPRAAFIGWLKKKPKNP